jgi:hypothetical protein
MAGEGQFLSGGEDGDACSFGLFNGRGAALHEGGFREIEFARDGLHLLGGELSGIHHHGEGIARQRGVGEDIDDEVTQCAAGACASGIGIVRHGMIIDVRVYDV